VVEGALERRVATGDGANLVLFYGGEERGSLEPCGCPNRPRGGMPRLMAYVAASRAANPGQADLLVNGGYWLEDAMGLDGGLRADVPVMNAWMLKGVEAVGFDAVNLSYQDLPGVDPLEAMPPWSLSANIKAADGAPAPPTWQRIERGDLVIGVTGITEPGMTFVETPDYTITDPVEAGRAVLEEMKGEVDVMILLAFQAPEAARVLADEFPELDVVVDAAMHREFYEPFVQNNAVWVRSHYQTMRLGELRLTLDDGRVVEVLDRKIDLDPQVPDEDTLKGMMRDARKELEAAQVDLFGG
jgi:2',3'-cyclic-nucleotide 2'-phosphodiesterase (5'-nucleotidase family)